MKFNMQAPPSPTGRYGTDIKALYNWCVRLYKQVGAVFRNIEDEQIKSLAADKLDSGDYFRLGNDGSYIEFIDGVIHVGGIVDDTQTAAVTLEEMV